VDLGKAVADALEILTATTEAAGARVTIATPLPASIAGNHGELVRLFQNLIGNAIKYRLPDRPPAVTISATCHGDAWELAIADNGIGIPAQFAERIFGVFQRLHGRGEYEGTGIGLAVCRKIVEHHGGRIWVESAGAGAGTTFRFTLPAAAPQARQAPVT
ncbi:MAG: PAS domain-containing sensor histidine kinase, partial [Magnetospirillum sp.]|nr:PAS domain-containing sensor histidine kinase [Magnetospirillum sp.]